jgi:hypothetical protein
VFTAVLQNGDRTHFIFDIYHALEVYHINLLVSDLYQRSFLILFLKNLASSLYHMLDHPVQY